MPVARALIETCVLLAVVVALGCGPREPGPHESEYGAVFFWRVDGSDVSFGDECTDAEGFRDGVTPPDFEPNSFLVYQLSDDGESAVTLDCETTDAASCSVPDTSITFDVVGHELVFDPDPRVEDIETSACDLEGDERWTVVDEGERAELATEVAFARVGEASVCDADEAAIAAQSENGKAFEGCVITLGVSLELYDTGRR